MIRRSVAITIGLMCAASAGLMPQQARQSAPSRAPEPETVYFDGQQLVIELAPAARGERVMRVGPWRFGARVATSKPQEARLNLYIVAPGEQHGTSEGNELTHSHIINELPEDGDMREWDVYYAVVLDPSLREEIRSEQSLIQLAQQHFRPGDLFEFDDMPGAAFMTEFMKLRNLDDLKRYRYKDGDLPRVIIAQAGFAIRARVLPPAKKP